MTAGPQDTGPPTKFADFVIQICNSGIKDPVFVDIAALGVALTAFVLWGPYVYREKRCLLEICKSCVLFWFLR